MEKQDIIDALSHYDKHILETALAYAINLWDYGVDVTQKWETATANAYVLDKAYRKAFADCESQHAHACTTCKSRLEGVKPF